MALVPMYNGEQLKAVLEFDNGQTYTCITSNQDNNVLTVGRINENDAITSGNPLGIMSSNTLNLEILDKDNLLVQTNQDSPYFGYMRNGVKVSLTVLPGDIKFGTYYTDGWDNTRRDGYFGTSNLNCQDKLNYIGNQEIPPLNAFSSVNIKDLLVAIFEGIGLTSDEYYIDPTLNLDLTFSVTKGAKLRDTLNSIAQALIARITMDRNEVIQVRPAFPEIPSDIDTLSDIYMTQAVIAHNPDTQFNRVRLDFTAMGIKESEILSTMNDTTLVPETTNINGMEIPNTTQGIDGVYVEVDVTPENYKSVITDIQYTGYQGGISTSIVSELTANIKGNVSVEGRTAGATKMSLYSNVKSTDAKVANLLPLSNDYIQNKIAAQDYLDKVVTYLEKLSFKMRFNSLVAPSTVTGTYISVASYDSNISGTYYIMGTNITFAEAYNVELTCIKIIS